MSVEDHGDDPDRPYGAEPLTAEERASFVATKACKGDWGPVFVYGSMLFPTAWSDLIGHLPEMKSATLRNYERRCFVTGGFAGLFANPGKSVVGMLVSGLLPKERLLLDAVIDDSFVLRDVTVEYTGDAEPLMVITDCGYAAFNGRYVPDGTSEGRTRYRHATPGANDLHRTIHFEHGEWRLCEEYKGYFYKSDWNGKYPPPNADDWVIDAEGLTPLPVVAREPVTIECSTYVLRTACQDAMDDGDWDFEVFATEHLEGFTALCRDTQIWREDEKLPEDILKELALARRRRQTGFEDDEDEEGDGGGGGAPQEEVPDTDPDWVDRRLGLRFVVGIIRLAAIIAPEHLHDASWLQPVVEPLAESEGGRGRTPAEELAHLEANEKAELGRKRKQRGMKYPKEPGPREAGDVVERLRSGEIRLHGQPQDLKPFVPNGLPPSRGSDFCVASVPFGRYDWYARAVVVCALYRVGLAAVSHVLHEDVWLYAWKRNVEKMVAQGKTLVVLTQVEKHGGTKDMPGLGKIDFMQSVQVLWLQQKGHKFFVVDIMEFCRDMQPVLFAAAENDFDSVEQALMARREIVVPVVNAVDHTGRTAMHYVARLGPSERVIRMLLEAGECLNAIQWGCDEHGPGWTPLMHAVVYGPHRMVKVLLESNADAHVVNLHGKDAFALAAKAGQPKNERMLSQCHWRCCLTCTRNEEDKPPPDNPIEEGKLTSAQVHAANCHICSRFI